MIAKNFKRLLEKLCSYGIGKYYILHKSETHVYFGNINFEKGHLAVQDTGVLSDISPALFEPVWNEGLIGMVCHSKSQDWDSLTFYGLEHCDTAPDLSSTRGNSLIAAENEYGDSLIDFEGSIYRGFDLLLENSFLPVILLTPMKSKHDEIGLMVSDMRTAPMNIKILLKLNDMVTQSIQMSKTMKVDDVDMSAEEFKKYFSTYDT
jgi:hypothetical protein